jgi:transposase-like protein
MKDVLIPCPKCSQPGIYMKGLSQSSSVDYYRCDDCQHVWTVPKDEREPTTDAPVV